MDFSAVHSLLTAVQYPLSPFGKVAGEAREESPHTSLVEIRSSTDETA
jgi:hypothetical protein